MKWEMVKLGDVCEKIISGGTPSTDNPEYWIEEVPWVSSADILDHKTLIIRRGISKSWKPNILPSGNILVVTRVGLGKVIVNKQAVSFSQDIQGLILNKAVINSQYLLYALIKKLSKFKEVARGATIKGVTRDDLVNISIPLPPLRIQEQIADTLDKADALRRKDQELLQKYDDLAQAIFYDMFGDPVRNEKGWIKCLLKDLVEVKGGKRLPLGSDFSSTETDYPYIRVKDFENQSVNLTNLKYITAETHKIIKRYIINRGDVYISIAGTIGLCGTLPEVLDGANLTENAAKLVIRDKNLLTPDYLSAFLMSPYGQGEITKRTMAVGVPKLAIFRIEELDILLPPLEVQNSYVDKLQKISEVKVQTEKCQQKTESMFRSFLATSFS